MATSDPKHNDQNPPSERQKRQTARCRAVAENLTSCGSLFRKNQRRAGRSVWRACAVLVTAAMFLFQEASTQDNRCSLRGSVVDASGARVPGARIDARVQSSAEDHVDARTMSDAEGNFNLTDLVPGTYEIKVFARGFRVAILSNLQVAVGQTQGIEVKVRVPATTMAGGVHTHGGAAGGGAAGSGGEGQPKDGAPTPMPQLTPPPLELQKFHEPVWNVWTENTKVDSPTFKPVDMLPGHSYLLVVDLAALQYAKYASQAYSHEASPAFDNWLARNPDDETTVKVLAIPDDRFFQNMVGKQSQKLLINLKKLRATQQQGFQLTGSPFEYLATHNGDAPFTFGKAIFRVKTKDNAVGTDWRLPLQHVQLGC